MSALTISSASMDDSTMHEVMSHLNEDEKRKILNVIKRAQALEKEAAVCSRYYCYLCKLFI